MNQKPNTLQRLRASHIGVPLLVLCVLGCKSESTYVAVISDEPQTAIDIRSIDPDLQVPELKPGPGRAGHRFKETLPDYKKTKIYHVVHLPDDWKPGGRFPVLVEFGGNGNYTNKFGDSCDGRVESCKLGFGISGGTQFIWICLPFVNGTNTENCSTWWGDRPEFNPQPTIEYCKKAVPWICEKYGGDRDRVVLTGFSRGAIACNFIGLHDDAIAKIWCAFVPFSHYDGVFEGWGYPGCDRVSAAARLSRLGNRPQFICAESGKGRHSIAATRDYLSGTDTKGEWTFQESGFRNHNDAWILRPSPARAKLRDWLQRIVNR